MGYDYALVHLFYTIPPAVALTFLYHPLSTSLGIYKLLFLIVGIGLVLKGGEGLYMGLILVWAGPFVLLLWSLAYQLIIELPLSNTLIPIALPTLYLWIVDTLALRRGTWVIESGTKLGWHLWDGLEVEEAVFFLATNALIVFGLIAFDTAFAILAAFPSAFPTIPILPSPLLLIRALLVPTAAYDDDRIEGLQEALARLRAKSRSFYLASGVFQGRLRIDLVLLYSFCRVADDLVDEANTVDEAKGWIALLKRYLDICYSTGASEKHLPRDEFVVSSFPASAQAALTLLPTHDLSPQPLYDLLKGFETDLHFSSANPYPIEDLPTLQLYGARVAGTVAQSCLELVFHHTKTQMPREQQRYIAQAGSRMGIALQYVNIARDISVDASNGRVYLPTTWLRDEGLTPKDIIKVPNSTQSERLRQRLLDSAMEIYDEAKGAIESLPQEARGPMRVAVESYVEIGRVLRKPGYKVKAGRATVPKLRRLTVAWKALNKK
ncbi:15-cis-phytoene synthase / lycopene beta-cyclase, partial [Lecanoromycetidae sp. Uapishka_2]